MVSNMKKVTVIGLVVFAAFCMLSCSTVGSLASGLLGSGSSESSKSSATAGQDIDPSKPGWQQDKNGNWVYVQGEGRALPPKSSDSSSSSSSSSSSTPSVKRTDRFNIRNDLPGRPVIRVVYISAYNSSSESQLSITMLAGNSVQSTSIPFSVQNDANRFNLRAVADKGGAEYKLSNVTIDQDGEVVFK